MKLAIFDPAVWLVIGVGWNLVVIAWPKLAEDVGNVLRRYASGARLFYRAIRGGMRSYAAAHRTGYWESIPEKEEKTNG